MVEDRPLQQRCRQTEHELVAIRSELQKLTGLLISRELGPRGRSTRTMRHQEKICATDLLKQGCVRQPSTSSQRNLQPDAVDVFYDCVSHVSEACVLEYQDQAWSSLSESPFSYFESGPSFYGEQYTTENHVGRIAAIVAVVKFPCTKTHRLKRYHLIYAETARSWRRVTVSTMIQRASQCSSSESKAAPGAESYPSEIVPSYLYEQLPGLLRSTSFFGTVTEVSASVKEYASGCYTINAPSTFVAEDLEESRKSEEEKMLQDIEHTGCHQYLESEVIVKKLIKSSTFLVQVEGLTYIERKMPFSKAALPGNDGVKEFYEHLRMAHSLRDCDSVAKFAGVVLDDARSHLKSYLEEFPALGTLRNMFSYAQLRGRRIPWSIRELWAAQTITAVSQVHSKGAVVGMLNVRAISVRLDGRIALSLRSHGHIYGHSVSHEGEVDRGPAIQGHGMLENERRTLDFCADIFELGLTLWMIAEHKGNTHGYFCSRNACTSVPRYLCQAEHANPFELPPCSDNEAPPWFDEVISECRKVNSKHRSTARDLLRHFDKTTTPPALADLKTHFGETGNHNVSCDECGTYVGSDVYFHCHTCNLGDFDLCQHCVSQGIRCPDKTHLLIKRRIEENLYMGQR
ncbi:MAG: hypothetical protein Q9207_008375 [Kuettlingeria erythrocarpa]